MNINLLNYILKFAEIKMSAWENNEEIKIFREYLRIPSVHPNIDYGKSIQNSVKKILSGFLFNKYVSQIFY